MVQEDQILGCSYSGGGGGGGSGGGGGGGGGGGSGCSGGGSSRSKKIKQKKVPQRGLGVAQLEKIRLEEQQKKQSLQAANILAKNAIGSSNNSNNPPFLGVRPSISPFHTLTPPSSTTANLPSPNALYKPVSSIDIRQENPAQIPGKLDSSGGEMDFRTGNGNWPKLWNGEYNLEEERKGMDHHGFAFETNPAILPLPIVPHRSHQFQRPSSSSSSMVNSSSGISPPSELSSQMEPPSNQNFRGNTYSPLWTEEDKMVGMKRSYPFSLESQPAPSLHSSFHRSYAASISKSDELASPSNGYTAFTEPRNKCIREGPSNFSPPPERNPNQTNRDNGRLNGDFLTLAPPSVASPPLDSKHKHHLDYSGHLRHELSEYEIISSQEYAKSRIHEPGPSESVEQPFSFFPIKLPTDQCNNGEKGETIDLNLKL